MATYTALYRKWRPQIFEDVVGQKHITQTLKNQIKSERIGHAYLLCGTRGTGKTSTAKIFSRAINCIDIQKGNPCNVCDVCKGILNGSIMDVIEIDAASNNGVDNIREIREEVVYTPSKGKYKVYIIDEVHMLSVGAFNALLKTLEEPPKHVMFILATTEPHKIPATILSRCQRFDFKRITSEDIVGRLEEIAQKDKITIDEASLRLIAKVAQGSMRDALSVLDQCIAFSDSAIEYKYISAILGIVDDALLFDISQAIADQDISSVMLLIERITIEGRDINQFMEDLTQYFRNLLMCKVVEKVETVIDVTQETIDALKNHSHKLSQEKIIKCIHTIGEAQSAAKWATNPRMILEIALIKLCKNTLDVSAEALLERIVTLEQQIATGAVTLQTKSSKQKDTSLPNTNNPKPVSKKSSNKKQMMPPTEQIKQIMSHWPEVLEQIKKAGKVVLFGYLTDTIIQRVENDVAIVFENQATLNKMMVSKKENITLIQDVIHKMVGQQVSIKCYFEKELEQGQSKAQPQAEDKIEKLINMQDELAHIEVYDE